MHAMKAYGGNRGVALLILKTLHQMRWVDSSIPSSFSPQERAPNTHEAGDLEGPRHSMDAS